MANNSYWDRSTTPLNNSNYSALLTWAEGQLPSTVNNSARQDLAYDAAFLDEQSGQNTVGGTANALTITPVFSIASYVDRMQYVIKAASDNTTAATFNVSGVGAKAIRKISGGTDVALAAGDMLAGGFYRLIYASAANAAAGAWVLVNPNADLSGSFTPAFSSTGATFSYLTQSGIYSKNGQNVSYWITLTLNTAGNTLTANPITVVNLPFTSGTGRSVVNCEWANFGSSYVKVGGEIGAGATSIMLYGITAASVTSGTVVNSSALLSPTAGSVMLLSGSYKAA